MNARFSRARCVKGSNPCLAACVAVLRGRSHQPGFRIKGRASRPERSLRSQSARPGLQPFSLQERAVRPASCYRLRRERAHRLALSPLQLSARLGHQPFSWHERSFRGGHAPCRGLCRGPKSRSVFTPTRPAQNESASQGRIANRGPQPACALPPAWANHSVNLRANGMPPGPSRRYAVHFLRLGPGITPSSPGYLER